MEHDCKYRRAIEHYNLGCIASCQDRRDRGICDLYMDQGLTCAGCPMNEIIEPSEEGWACDELHFDLTTK